MELDNFPLDPLINNQRNSMKRALTAKDYDYAFEKISINIKIICKHIKQVQDYSLHIGSINDNKENNYKMENIILNTAELFNEIFQLLSDIKSFSYDTKNEKISNITHAKKLDDQCHYYKKIFEDLTSTIKIQNMNIIEKQKNFAKISMSSLSFEYQQTSDTSSSKEEKLFCQNGRDYLDGIEMKERQNSSIDKTTFKINSIVANKDLINLLLKETKAGIHRRMESIEISQKRIEPSVTKAFQPLSNRHYCSRKYVYVLMLIVLAAIFIGSQL